MVDAIEERRSRGRPRSIAPSAEGAGVQSLDRAILLMKVIAGGDGQSLTEVARAAGLAPSTTYRMLTTLQHHDMAEFDEANQLWSIGVETFRIGSAFLRRRKLVERGRPVIERLMTLSGETANLAIAEPDAIIFVNQVETHEPIRAFFRPGTRSSYHASGIGKAVLAHLPPARARIACGSGPLARFTDRTFTDRPALEAELERIRRRGYSVDDEEVNDGMRCVAAAIFNEFAEPIGGISVSGPSFRLTEARLDVLGHSVGDAAAEITAQFGGSVPQP